jgi:hypothetical protein
MRVKFQRSHPVYLLRNGWVRVAIVLTVLAPFIAFFWYLITPRPYPDFRATVHTQTLTFRLGEWPNSGGIFNSASERVDFTLLSPGMVRSTDGSDISCNSGSILRNVRLFGVSTPVKQAVSLDALSSGSLRFTLTADKGSPQPFTLLQVDDRSDVGGLSCDRHLRHQADEEFRIVPSLDSNALEFSVAFLSPKSPEEKVPEQETDIPLDDDSTMVFQGEDGLIGAASELELLHSEKEVQLYRGFSLSGIRKGVIESLSYDPPSRSLTTTVAGTAGKIKVKSGGDWIPVTESRLPHWMMSDFGGNFLVAMAAFFAALLAIAGTAWNVLVNKKQHEQRLHHENALAAADRKHELNLAIKRGELSKSKESKTDAP